MSSDHMQIQVKESMYTSVVSGLYEKLLDLNVPMSTVAQQSTELMQLRDELLDAYGVVQAPAVAAVVAAKKPKQAPPQPKKDREVTFGPLVAGQFRMKLQEVAAKRAGRPSTKDDFAFEHVHAEGEKTYIATLTSELLQNGPYKGETPEVSKRASEQAVCEVAMKAEFPEVFAQMVALGPGPDRGLKRKAPDEDPVFPNSKSKLSHVLTLLLLRPITKDDILYDMESGNGGFTSNVIIPYKGVKKFKGTTRASKKDAEASAADACLEALKEPIAVAMEEHKAKKIQKHAEDMARLDARKAARDAEAAAAAGK